MGYQAEVYAISLATNWVLQNTHRTRMVHIYSDSRAALQAITRYDTKTERAQQIVENFRRLYNLGITTKLFWIKAHAGHTGNEKADQTAKAATREDLITQIEPPIVTLKRRVADSIREEWVNWWDSCDKGRQLYEICRKPMRKTVQFNREVYMLLTGHGPFNRYYDRFALRETGPFCVCEREEDDLRHILLECGDPRRERARQRFRNKSLQLGEPWPPRIPENISQQLTDYIIL